MKQSKMAFLSLAIPFVILGAFGSLSARAADETSSQMSEEGHPCAEYVKHCKAKDLTPGHGLWKCVAKEAKKAKNEVCMAKIKEGAKKMREHKKHKADAETTAQPNSQPSTQKEAE
jgi:hypothetical protein